VLFTRRQAMTSGGALAVAAALPHTTAAAQATRPSQPTVSQGGFDPVCLADFEPLAKARMPVMGWEYISGGAGDELTMKWNKEAFERILDPVYFATSPNWTHA